MIFSLKINQILLKASNLAKELGHKNYCGLHVLDALMIKDVVVFNILNKFGVDPGFIFNKLKYSGNKFRMSQVNTYKSPSFKKALEVAQDYAKNYGIKEIEPIHILHGILNMPKDNIVIETLLHFAPLKYYCQEIFVHIIKPSFKNQVTIE